MSEVRSKWSAALAALRPRQWIKNGVVFAPLLFSRTLFEPERVVQAMFAAAAFCLLSGGIYVFNDWIDRERDRLHPEKLRRPFATGELGGRFAVGLIVGAGFAAAALEARLPWRFAAVCGGYLALQIAYSLFLKRWAVLDVGVIALGFVLRVVGGGVAIDVPVSNWLYLCTLLLAVFLGFAKRRHELSSLQDSADAHRANLADYSLPMLDQMITVAAAACVVSYGLYTVAQDTVAKVGSDRLKLTVPFVLYGIFRYLFLIHRRGLGGSPERILLTDRAMILTVLLFAVVAGVVLYAR